jgi:cellulose biosynthesis protein BcsQ
MGRIIAITNLKGGVGKTTTSINLGACLAVLEKKTLIIDADPQGNTTCAFGGFNEENGACTQDLFNFSNENKITPLATKSSNLDLLPTTIKLANLDINGKNLYGTNHELKKALNYLKLKYDYIIVDCSPSVNFITTSFLSNSDSVLIPMQCEYYALHGLNNLFNVIKTIKKNYNNSLDIEGILITMYDKRLIFSNLIVNEIIKNFQSLVFSTIIPRSVKLSESQSHEKTIIEYDATCIGAEKYLTLASEIIENNKNMDEFSLGKNLNQIIEEVDKNNDLSAIFDQLPINKSKDGFSNLYSNSFEKLIGLNKTDIKSIFGDSFNDLHSKVWMYRLTEDKSLFKKKYLYLYFDNDRVKNVSTTFFKKSDV